MQIGLGDEVEDIITGFRGIATARHIFLHGNTNITVQPVVEAYANLPEAENFVESQLKVVKKQTLRIAGGS